MRTASRILLITLSVVLLLPAAGCNATGSAGSREPAAGAGSRIDDGRLIGLEARLIGLTEELDRFGRRLKALERSLNGGALVREPEASPPEESSPVRDEPVVDEPAAPEPEVEKPVVPSEQESPESPAPPPDPIEDWPTPEKSGPTTSILIDGRKIPTGSLPGTSQTQWRIVDPEAVTIFSSADVDPQVLRTRPLFWTAKAGTTLGPASIPVLGKKPLTVIAVDGALLPGEPRAEAVIYLDAETAAKLRGLNNLGELVRSGSLAILLRPDEE
jgi:hypothetical protein